MSPIVELNRLNNLQSGLEKSLFTIYENLGRSDREITGELVKFQTDRDKIHTHNKSLVQITLQKLKHKLVLIQNDKLDEINDFSQFKSELVQLQTNIEDLKGESRRHVDQLTKDEEMLNEHVLYYANKIEDWSKPIRKDVEFKNVKQKVMTCPRTELPEDVKKFMDFIHASGGHENGWTKDDHKVYLKLLNKHKSTKNLIRQLREVFPDMTEEDIKKHDDWYKLYQQLNDKKKIAIQEWKKDKIAAEQPQTPKKIVHKVKPTFTINKEEQLLNLERWKAEKMQRLRNSLQFQQQNEEHKKQLQIKQKKRNEETKQIVEIWKEKKLRTQSIIQLEQEISEEAARRQRVAEANRLIKHFQSQDDLMLREKIAGKFDCEKTIVKPKLSCEAKRDPERLFQPTLQWIQRVKNDPKEDLFQFKPSPFIKHIPKLGVPAWRQKSE